jgi:hypothetical protein
MTQAEPNEYPDAGFASKWVNEKYPRIFGRPWRQISIYAQR